jgi:hypothetical protein
MIIIFVILILITMIIIFVIIIRTFDASRNQWICDARRE